MMDTLTKSLLVAATGILGVWISATASAAPEDGGRYDATVVAVDTNGRAVNVRVKGDSFLACDQERQKTVWDYLNRDGYTLTDPGTCRNSYIKIADWVIERLKASKLKFKVGDVTLPEPAPICPICVEQFDATVTMTEFAGNPMALDSRVNDFVDSILPELEWLAEEVETGANEY